MATQTAAIDPRTGQIDMGRLSTGHAANEQDSVTALAGTLREMLSRRGRGETLTVGAIVKELAMIGGSGGGGGGEGGEGYGEGGGGMAGAAPHNASSEEVLEALRILEGEGRPILRMQGNSRITIIA